ncbi:nucleotide-binding universal stress UspA family protein [Algoriphagus ratkowskyi]|uniref:Nucleotide-binding universal stress UspA family protein n=1 Tax=Algoriphagus ratkowskyi TaxID=57028 RepID=A0A2W7QU70_9BACT|nr:universal stress protein [Algoriphagus ratkowskyi]PZX51531.1 nucleotide-binding universal stress UspA family protein [Algoriphagus ratkowskyi]TXD78813.1 universal stress protein [Algoriphagus ratkowskyi]
MKILLAIDGSDFSKSAVKELAKMPLSNDSEISVMNVYEHPTVWAPDLLTMETVRPYYKEVISRAEKSAEKSAEKTVSEAANALKNKNGTLKITTSVVSGLPKKEILEQAEAFGADLIVLGSQGHGALSRFLLGSVSQYIATHAKCSVMIARNEDEK